MATAFLNRPGRVISPHLLQQLATCIVDSVGGERRAQSRVWSSSDRANKVAR